MAKSVFTKNRLKAFFIFLLVVAIVSVGAAIGLYYYFGHSVPGDDITEGLDDKLKLGRSFTVEDVIEQEKYNYAWLSSDNVEVEVYATNKSGESNVTREVLAYDIENRTFTVVGIATGYIKFISDFDSTINFSVSYVSSFISKDTESILFENYSNIVEDEVITCSELLSVEVLTISNKGNVDLADFVKFSNLKKLEIKNGIDEELINFKNFNLPSDTNIYVSTAKYLEYINRNESEWAIYKTRIYPASSFEQHSIVLYKNGGLLPDDNRLDFKSVAVDDGETLNLSTDYAIKKVGYQFVGWFVSSDGITTQGEPISDDYHFTSDIKLVAKWEANTYTVRMYNNDETDSYVDKLFTYDVEDVISDTSPLYSGFVHLGWAKASDSMSIDFEKQQVVKNLTENNNEIIEVYAIWAHSTIKLQFYSWDNNKVYQKYGTEKSCSYGDSILLNDAGGEPSSPYGSFTGWSLKPDGVKLDYHYGDIIKINSDNIFLTSKVENILKIYAIFELESYDVIYEEDGGLPELSRVNNIARGVSFNINGPIEKEGYKFMGWKDNTGYIWTCEDIYLSNQAYFDSNFINRMKIVNLTEFGFNAESGINTVSATQVVLTAVWRANTFNIKFNNANATSIFNSATATYDLECSFTGDTTRVGWGYTVMNSNVGNVQLVGRSLDAEQIKTLYLALKGDSSNNNFDESSFVTFTPNWSQNSYTVSFNSNGGSACTSITVVFDNTYGSLPTPTRSSTQSGKNQTDYTFTGWTYNGSKITSGTKVTTASNHTLTANWSSNTWKYKCVAEGTSIRLADGSSKKVEELSGDEKILSWDFYSGKMIETKIALINTHEKDWYEILKLNFEDDSYIEIIGSHGFYDCSLNEFVYIDENNYTSYIGHTFLKYDNETSEWSSMKLTDVTVYSKYTTTYSIWAAVGLTCLSNDFLSVGPRGYMFGFGYFDIVNMKYDQEEISADIDRYGLYEYEEFSEYVTYEQFVAFNGAYLKIAVGKGLTTYEEIIALIKRCLG